jgi:hypothetical protein
MTDRSMGPRCGNNPNTRLTDGDRKAVNDFKARLALKEAAKPYIERAAWVDFDPLMEVIAATIWEHCARDSEDMPQLVRDDPRTIAAFAAAVARAHAAGVAPATDQPSPSRRAGLRDEIVKALGRIKTIPPVAHRREQADHVLAVLYREWPWLRAEAEDAVLPATVDRAAVYAEVADRLAADAEQGAKEGFTRIYRRSAAKQVREWGEELRRVAAESAPADTGHGTMPRRGDQFEAWLKTQRDRYDRTDQREESSEFWHEFDAALDLYRLHADTGTPLSEHVCEGRVVGNCECLEQPAADPQPVSDEFVQQLATVKVREDSETPIAAPEPRHTCHDQKSAPGHDWECQWCSTLPDDIGPAAAQQPKEA